MSWGCIWAPPDGKGGEVGWRRPSNGWAGGQPDVIGIILSGSTWEPQELPGVVLTRTVQTSTPCLFSRQV